MSRYEVTESQKYVNLFTNNKKGSSQHIAVPG